MGKFKFKSYQKINITKIVAKLVATIISLYVGNELMTQMGNLFNQTEGPFNTGFKLIGWTVGGYQSCVGNSSLYSTTCEYSCAVNSSTQAGTSCITGVSGAGILTVVGLIGLASIVMEFIEYKM